MNSSFVDAMVREADPIDPAHVDAWRRSPAARAIRTRAPGEPVGVVGPRRLRRATAAALAAAILVVLGAGVGAATVLLGKPAPPKVKEDLRGVDAGFPADLRYDPDVADARSVATTGTSTLYYARLKDGGSCTELVTSGVPRGAVCTTLAQARTEPIQITVPFTDPITAASPVTIGGHVNVPGATSLEIRYGDGSIDPITIGDEGFFVFEVPSSHLGVVHASRFSIVAADAGGQEVGRADVPAILEEPDGPIQDTAPITVDTISDGSDFTRVLGVRGRVNADGVASLEFRYPDGTTVAVPLQADGGYRFDIPSERQGDLFAGPGTLVALDRNGDEVASAPVAAVAFWRAHQDGTGG